MDEYAILITALCPAAADSEQQVINELNTTAGEEVVALVFEFLDMVHDIYMKHSSSLLRCCGSCQLNDRYRLHSYCIGHDVLLYSKEY
jgi:hypothetical protein